MGLDEAISQLGAFGYQVVKEPNTLVSFFLPADISPDEEKKDIKGSWSYCYTPEQVFALLQAVKEERERTYFNGGL